MLVKTFTKLDPKAAGSSTFKPIKQTLELINVVPATGPVELQELLGAFQRGPADAEIAAKLLASLRQSPARWGVQATTRVDAVAPTSTIRSLPAVTRTASFTVSWSGQDDAGGSGLATFSETNKVDVGSGRTNDTGAYLKPTTLGANQGAIYCTAGTSGQAGGGTLNHPVMFMSVNILGSVVLDVEGDRLDFKFLTSSGTIPASTRSVEVLPAPLRPTIPTVSPGSIPSVTP